MDFSGQIEGLKFSPISNYNSFLKETASFDVDAGMEFENILNKQSEKLQSQNKIQGGIELNRIDDVVGRNSVQSIEGSDSTGTFISSVGNSINGGLSSVNNAVEAANKAQEAFAAGENVSVHDVMIASEKASLSLSMAIQLRNKLLGAYNEINNIKV